MNIWKRGVCLLLTLVMAAALAGCGTRREPQTLRVCLPELPGTLDPAMVTTDSERIVVSHLYENLMKLSSDGQGGSRVEAGAARKYTCTDNNDGTQTYTFTLRDMKWSDGQKVTAADFVYAWQRLADPATASPNAALLEMVAGYRQVRSSGDVSKLQVSAPEENTFVVTLSNRCAYFLSAVCTAAATMPVRSEQPKNWQADPTALCTNGAYRISEWKNGLLTATVPESYYDQRRLQMSTLVFRFETDAAMRTELLKKNEVDFVLGLSQEELADEPETWTPDSYPQVMTLLVNQMAQSLASEELRQWASGSKEGEFFYSHAYDMLMGVAADCGEVEVRDAYLEDAERLLLETGYVCPLYFTGQSSRLSSAYTGLLTDGIGGYYFTHVGQQSNG